MERLVKCIKIDGQLLPILDEHDGDISDHRHAHIDYRFIENPSEVFNKFYVACYLGLQAAIDKEEACKLPNNYTTPDYEDAGYHRMKMINPNIFHDGSCPEMKAHFDEYPLRKNYQRLQTMCENKVMKSCMICPHQGLDLSEFPTTEIDGHQVKLCPNHQLAWNLETGKLVKRMPK